MPGQTLEPNSEARGRLVQPWQTENEVPPAALNLARRSASPPLTRARAEAQFRLGVPEALQKPSR